VLARGASPTDIIFYLQAHKAEVYGERLRPQDVKRIRGEARQELLGELRAEIASLDDPAARRALVAAVRSDAASGPPPGSVNGVT
jgi:hypothetical protein